MELGFVYTESCTNVQRAREVFREMRALGADMVLICVYEQDLLRWKRDMARLFDAAAEAGLRRYVSYGRQGNIFSGLLMMPSLFGFTHPETLIVTESSGVVAEAGSSFNRFWSQVCCANNPKFQNYMEEQTREILDRFNPEGLMFDEPKGLAFVCKCQYCQSAQQAGEDPKAANLRGQVKFVEKLCDQAKAHRGDICTMITTGHTEDAALQQFAAVSNLDVLGTEAYWVSRGMTIDELRAWCIPALEKLRSYGKKTQIWTQNFGLPPSETENLHEAYSIMAEGKPDQLISFWWWRENEEAERVMEISGQSMKRLAKEQRSTHALS